MWSCEVVSGFGDAEPEDAWHPDDPIDAQLRNLSKRLDLLDARTLDHEHIDALERRLAFYISRRSSLRERDQLRVDQLREDLAFVRSR